MAEWLPVSSSAHLALVRRLVDGPARSDPRTDQALDAALHLGSALAGAWVLRDDVCRLVPASVRVLRRRGRAVGDDERLARTVVLAGLPAVVVGGLGAGLVADRLGGPDQVATVLAGAGVALYVADRRSPQRTVLATHHGPHTAALAAGQVAALVPGVSRLGGSLTAARLTGVERRSAVRLALLCGLPLQAGAAVRTLPTLGGAALRAQAGPMLGGGATAALVGAAAGPAAMRLLPAHSLVSVALYRGLLAGVITRTRLP